MRTTETILVVEDEPDAVLLLKRAFQKAGVVNPIQTVDNGERAIAYLQGDAEFQDRTTFPLPLVVLLDWKLPRRSGLEVLQWVRAHPLLRSLPVVVLSSSRERADVSRAYAHGANAYLVKPTSQSSLVQLAEAFRDYWVLHNEPPLLPDAK